MTATFISIGPLLPYERGLPSQDKGAGLRVPSRRGSWVQIPPPALLIKDGMNVIYSTIKFLVSTVPIIALASYFVSYSINKGIMEKIALKIEPVLRRLNLDQITITSVAVCFISPTAAYSMLSQALKEGKIDEKEVIAASFLNSFPATFSHIYTFFLPFVIPILGWAGVLYTCLRLLVALFKSIIGLILASMWRRDGGVGGSFKRRRVDPLKSTLENLKRIVPMMAVTYFFVSVLSEYGFFDSMRHVLNVLPFDPNVLTISAVEFVNVRAAVVVSAGMLRNGVLTPKWIVIGLILGNVITLSTRFVKHSLPLHLSLFGRLGIKIVLLNAIVTLLLDMAIVLMLIYLPV